MGRLALKPAISQVIDLIVALLLFFPEGEVLLEQLDDALGVAEVVLLQLVDLVEGLLQRVVGELASLGVVLQHLVVEDGEVEGKTELDRVASWKVDGVSLFISLLSLTLDFLKLDLLGVLSDVSVVVTDHLDEESLGLLSAVSVQDTGVDHINDLLAVLHELLLDLLLVGEESSVELAVLGVLLDGRDSAASSSLAGDEVLESDGKKVSLIGIDRATLDDEDLLEEVNHVFEALSLLGDTGEEYLLFNVGHLK